MTAQDTENDHSLAPKSAQTAPHTPMTEEQIRAVHIGALRPLSQSITIADYDAEWPRLFEREAARVRSLLADRVMLLEHVGSTSVPGLAAKPKIDMLLVVTNSADESAYVADLQAAGYVLQVREPDWYEHRLFKGPDTDINLHVFSSGCPEIEQQICRLVFGDADSAPPSPVARFFEQLSGGKADAGWDGSNMPRSRLALLPGTTHYNIFSSPASVPIEVPFLDAPMPELGSAADV